MNFIAYRMVGGWAKPSSTFLCRLRWAVTCALFMSFAALVHRQSWAEIGMIGALTLISAFAGRLFSNRRAIGEANWKNTVTMSIVGLIRLTITLLPYALVSVPFSFDHAPRLILALFGLLQGPCYFIAWKFFDYVDSGLYFRNDKKQWHIEAVQVAQSGPETLLQSFAFHGSEWGETLTGVFCYNLPYLLLLVIY